MREFNDKARPPPQKELTRLIRDLSYRHSAWQVFSDFVEMGAISISNAVDSGPRERREARYMEIIKRYKPDELETFPRMLAQLVLALEEEPADILGRTFHDLELHNKYAGQFFTPYDVCRMMAKMTLGDDLAEKIDARGFVTAMEPVAGGGAMLIAMAHEMRDREINYQTHLHVTAVDIDAKCVHMTYLQLALLHVPAIVIHGNSLTLEEFDHWRTPAHIMGGWDWKLRREASADVRHEIETPPPVTRDEPERRDPLGPQLTLF